MGYPGDLASSVLSSFASVFASDPAGARAFLEKDFSWIDCLRETDDAFGDRRHSDEAQALLEKARALAAGYRRRR